MPTLTPARRSGSALLPAFLLLPLLVAALPAGRAQAEGAVPLASRQGAQVQVRKSGRELSPTTSLRARSLLAAAPAVAAPRSTWQVTYAGFTTAAQSAFQAAVDVWASVVSSPVPIKVNAQFTPMAAGLLGQAGASTDYRSPTLGNGVNWYPSALADALVGYDVAAASGGPASDISAAFSSSEPGFYFGTDGAVPVGKLDFMSVVMHEIGHGLGFSGSMDMLAGLVGTHSSPASIFDTYAVTPTGATLLSLANSSTVLGSALTTSGLGWDGSNARAANGGVRPRLYAPSTWQSGSSFSHLDEATYPPASPNALMTPMLDGREVAHSPGPITVGILRDLGWDAILPAPAASAPDAPSAVVATAGDASALVSWSPPASNGSTITGYTITGTPSGAATAAGTASSAWVSGLSNGTSYSFVVRATNAVGTSAPSQPSAAVIPAASGTPPPPPTGLPDLIAPVVLISSPSSGYSRSTAQSVDFVVYDPGRPTALLTTLCSLDGAAAAPCASPQAYTGLSQGPHTVTVLGLDEASNPGSASVSWVVDSLAPTVSVAAQPTYTLATATTLRFTGNGTGTSVTGYQVRARALPNSYGRGWRTTSASSISQPLVPGATICMSVRSLDQAGGASAWSPDRCTSAPLDEVALTASPGAWVRGRHSNYYLGTYAVAKRTGATLTRASVTTRRLDLVATVCPTCGSVGVYWNGRLLKSISLVRPTARAKQLLAVADFGAVRTGTLVVRTLNAKPTYVDGVGLARV